MENEVPPIAYELIGFPFDPSALTPPAGQKQNRKDVERAALWLEHVLPQRFALGKSILEALRAPVVRREEPRPGLLQLGQWLQSWFPVVAAPFVQRSYPSEPDWQPNWIRINSEDRLGSVSAAWPNQNRYSKLGDTLLHTLVIDLTAIVLDAAQFHGPKLTWSVESVESEDRGFVLSTRYVWGAHLGLDARLSGSVFRVNF